MKTFDRKLQRELQALLALLAENQLDETGEARVREILHTGSAARRFYIAYLDVHYELSRRGQMDVLFPVSIPRERVVAFSFVHALRFWLPWSAAAALIIFGLLFVFRSLPMTESKGRKQTVAFVGSSQKVIWNQTHVPAQVGLALNTGTYVIERGVLRLDFLNGAAATLEGPAAFRLVDANTIKVNYGRLAAVANVPSAHGFTVQTPMGILVDYGTEFSANVARDGKTQLHVFEGKVNAAVLNDRGDADVEQFVLAGQSRVVNPQLDAIQSEVIDPNVFLRMVEGQIPPLNIPPVYVDAVKRSGAAGYWRFGEIVRSEVTNEVTGGNPAREIYGTAQAMGDPRYAGVALTKASLHGNRLAVLADTPDWHGFQISLAKETPATNQDFTLEAWFCPTKLRMHTLFSLTDKSFVPEDEDLQSCTALSVFFSGLPDQFDKRDRKVCFRYNEQNTDGAADSVYGVSQGQYSPYHWYHVVLVRDTNAIRLYVNGQLESNTTLSQRETSNPIPAFLNIGTLPNRMGIWRKAVGAVGEVAYYGRALSDEEVVEHYALVEAAQGVDLNELTMDSNLELCPAPKGNTTLASYHHSNLTQDF